MNIVKKLSLFSIVFSMLFLVSCEDDSNDPATSGTLNITINVTNPDSWPAEGTVFCSLDKTWPPSGAPYKSVGVFGSGWCWLVQNDSSLEIMGTPNGENPLAHGKHALMGIDVWEHAYYLDYKNVRPDYVKAILDNSINWSFISDQLK